MNSLVKITSFDYVPPGPTADISFARPLVERLVKNGQETTGKFVVCAYGDGIAQVRHVPNEPDAVVGIMDATAELADLEGANVYLLPGLVRADLPEGQRGKKADVVAVLAIVADFDRHEGPAIDWHQKMPLFPGLVCETSPGNHQCWIFLDRPCRPDEVRPIAAALVNCTGCDAATKDMDHVFRVPGVLNYPNAKKLNEGRSSEPFQSRVVSDIDDWTLDISLDELRDAIVKANPDAFRPTLQPEPAKQQFDWDQRKKPQVPVDDPAIVRALSKDGDRSRHAFTVIRRLQRSGYSPNEIADVLMKFDNLPVMAHYGDPPEENRVRDDVRRAFEKRPEPVYEQTDASLFRILNTSDIAPDGADFQPPPLREIRVQGGARPENVKHAEAALVEQRIGIFQRGNMIVRPAEIRVEVRLGTTGDLLLVPVTAPALVEHITSAAKLARWDGRSGDWKTIDCPRDIAEALLARGGDWNLRALTGIISAPTLRPDGSLLDRPGYDPETWLLFDPRGIEFPAIPPHPTKDDARRALTVFDELIGRFPFASNEARAVALAAFLTICIRRTLPTAPIFGVDGTGAGSGKGLLSDTIAIVGSGRAASPLTTGANEEELEKRVGAMLKRGDVVICIDNITAPLESAFLCSALTQQTQSVRVLGQSNSLVLPTNCLFMATGNGLTFIGDMPRRAVTCLIDPAVEHPSERVFDFNPVDRAKEHRGRYVAAALTVLRSYRVAGMPPQKGRTMGSFEPWCRTVRDALLWLGEADPVATSIASADDPERERFTAVVTAWQSVIGEGRAVTLKEAIATAETALLGTNPRPELLDAFHSVAAPMVRGNGGKVDARRLGTWMRGKKRQVIRGLRFVPDGESAAGMRWRLEKLAGRGHDT